MSLGIGLNLSLKCHTCPSGGGCTHTIVTASWTTPDGRGNGIGPSDGSINPTTFGGESISDLYVIDASYFTVLNFSGNQVSGVTTIYMEVDGNNVTVTWNSGNSRYEGTGTSALFTALGNYGTPTCINITS